MASRDFSPLIYEEGYYMSHKNGNFSSSLGFILACVGSAVGPLATYGCSHIVWASSEGRHSWSLYLFLSACSVWTGLSAEFASEERQRQEPLGLMRALLGPQRQRRRRTFSLDGFPLWVPLGIAIGYSIIIGCAPLPGRFPDGCYSYRGFGRLFRTGHRKLRQLALAPGGGSNHRNYPG